MTLARLRPSRRRFVQGIAAMGGVLGSSFGRAWAATGEPSVLSGERIDLTIGPMPVNITGRPRIATVVNDLLPGPILRLREGSNVTINVTNKLTEPTSIHWHGLRLPNAMDGVPGLTFAGIKPGETFSYRFPIIQSGTYWYHSHSGMQEQTGLIGPMILEPVAKDSFRYDREHVVMLSDWTDEDPMTIVSNLKQQGDYYNYHQRTLGTFIADTKRDGLSATIQDRLMWGNMRMTPTDILDVSGAIYTYLVNGQPPAANWIGLFQPGERVRLRFINGSSMTTFDVRIPGLKLTIVQADGTNVMPVEVDEFRIAVAETYDVLVEPLGDNAYSIFAQAQDRTGYARATLAPRMGMRAEIPPMDPRPVRTMADMGMGNMQGMADTPGMDMSNGAGMSGLSKDNAGMNMPATGSSMAGMAMPDAAAESPPAMAGMDMKGMDMPANHAAAASPPVMPGMDMKNMDMSGRSHDAMSHDTMSNPTTKPSSVNADRIDPISLKGQPQVDNVAISTQDRQGEAGNGLDRNGRLVLTYANLRALVSSNMVAPTREIEFHLTGNMERWVWGFDGKRFSEAEPIRVKLGERVRFVLINDTMMEHPIHLHGFLFEVENGQGDRLPLKHTINVKPAERVSFVYTADLPGHWAFHCHLMYHMETGMFRTVLVA
jgi:CopA family copper-resistance protein